MMVYDIFNGDADGIFSVIQFQKKYPQKTKLITGIKRDIELLKDLEPNSDDYLRIFDISMKKNMPYLSGLLKRNIDIIYFDHHDPGNIPLKNNLESYISTSPNACTSLLVSAYLKKEFHIWAIPGIFGDNLSDVALEESKKLKLGYKEIQKLKILGELVNYNSYGETIGDLTVHPKLLLEEIIEYDSPLNVIDNKSSLINEIQEVFTSDYQQAKKSETLYTDENVSVIKMKNHISSNRISGYYSNHIANENPYKAHAIITTNKEKNIKVSIRAPLNKNKGAVAVAKKFPTGGGRERAAGINNLPIEMLDEFIKEFSSFYRK